MINKSYIPFYNSIWKSNNTFTKYDYFIINYPYAWEREFLRILKIINSDIIIKYHYKVDLIKRIAK